MPIPGLSPMKQYWSLGFMIWLYFCIGLKNLGRHQIMILFLTEPAACPEIFMFLFSDPDQRQCDCFCQRNPVLQSCQCDTRRGKCGRLQWFREAAGRHHPQERAGNSNSRRHPVTEGDHSQRDAGKLVNYFIFSSPPLSLLWTMLPMPGESRWKGWR